MQKPSSIYQFDQEDIKQATDIIAIIDQKLKEKLKATDITHYGIHLPYSEDISRKLQFYIKLQYLMLGWVDVRFKEQSDTSKGTNISFFDKTSLFV